MQEKIKEKIIDAGYAVIKEELLPRPKRIWLRTSLKGTFRSKGSCIKQKSTGWYRLVVNTTNARWFPDPKGKYIDKKTKERCRIADIGEERCHRNVVYDLAHEIAHLKYWDHSPEHYSYTEYIFGKLFGRLKNEQDVDIAEEE